MASSAQFIPYVVDTYHDPGYVGGEHRLVVELVAQEASVNATVEITKKGSGAVQAQDATVSAVVERTVNALEASLHDLPSNIVTVAGDGERSVVTLLANLTHVHSEIDDFHGVDGVAERIIVDQDATLAAQESSASGTTVITSNGTGAPKAQNATISGSGAVTRNGTGVLVSQDVAVTGTAEREINSSGTLQATPDSVVTGAGDTKRTAQGTLQPTTNNVVSGVSERSIVNVDTTPAAQSSSASGSGNNGRIASASLKPITSNFVAGIAERTINSSGSLTAQSSSVSGTSEREIDDQGGNTLTTQDAVVSGVAERVIVRPLLSLPDGLKPTINNIVSGVAERVITGSGELHDNIDIAVVGQSTRIIEDGGVTHALQPTTNNNIYGVAERIIPVTNSDLTADEIGVSAVTGDGEREVVTVTGTLATQDADVVADVKIGRVISAALDTFPVVLRTLGAERIVEDNGVTHALQPTVNNVVSGVGAVTKQASGSLQQSSSSVVSGLAERRIVDVDTTPAAQSCTVNAVAKRTVTSIEADLTAAEVGASGVAGVAEREIDDDTGNALTAQDAVVSGLAERSIVSVEADLTAAEVGASGVAGVAEREIDDNAGNALQAQSSSISVTANIGRLTSAALQPTANNLIVGLAERSIVSVEADLTAAEVGASGVAGVAEREIDDDTGNALTAQDVVVSGTAEREIRSAVALTTDASVVTAVTEITSNATGAMQAQDAVVSGVAERTIVIVDGDLTASEVGASGVAGVAEREIDDNLATHALRPTLNNVVAGVAERVIIATGSLQPNDSQVEVVPEIVSNSSGTPKAQDALVSGVAERTVVIVDGDLTSAEVGVSSVTGNGEREVVTEYAALVVADASDVAGVAERTVVDTDATPAAQSSTVAGVSERTVVGSGTAVSQDATVVCSAERIIVVVEADLTAAEVGASGVAGVAEREIDDQGGLSVEAGTSSASGVAERIIVVANGVPDSNGVAVIDAQPSTVNAVTKRTVISIEADLTADEVGVANVTGIADRTELTEVVPLVKAFRIKKPPLATITIRRPLGQVEV